MSADISRRRTAVTGRDAARCRPVTSGPHSRSAGCRLRRAAAGSALPASTSCSDDTPPSHTPSHGRNVAAAAAAAATATPTARRRRRPPPPPPAAAAAAAASRDCHSHSLDNFFGHRGNPRILCTETSWTNRRTSGLCVPSDYLKSAVTVSPSVRHRSKRMC